MNELEKKIEHIKRKLASFYMVLLFLEISLYACIYYFFAGNEIFAFCLLFFFFVILYTHFLINKTTLNLSFHLLFIYSLLLVTLISLSLQKESIVCLFWLMPLPMGAYIIFGKKTAVFYTGLAFFLVLSIRIAGEFVNMTVFSVPRDMLWITDSFVWFCDWITFYLLIYIDNKIRQATKDHFKNEAEPRQKISEISLKCENRYNKLFEQVRTMVEANFRDPDLSVGKIADKLKSNHMYIAQAVKAGGFDNFNDLVNFVRIRYVKEQMEEGALKTTTLFYIHSEAGFVNYSTFNRAFKKVEGTTPTDYIKQMNLPRHT